MQKHQVMQLLLAHHPHDAVEARHMRKTLEFVGRTADFHKRTNLEGHLTASGWILDSTGHHALLIHHAKLDRWLQPGGHIEPQDLSLGDAALREVMEETGLRDLRWHAKLFDVDVHAIRARGAEPDHLHYDCRFLFQIVDDSVLTISEEVHGFRWVSLDDLRMQANLPDSLRRMAIKTPCPGNSGQNNFTQNTGLDIVQ